MQEVVAHAGDGAEPGEGKEDKKDAVSLFLKMVVLTASHLFPTPRK